MKWLVRIIATLFVLFLILGLVVQFLFPKDATVTRTMTMDAPPSIVFDQVNTLTNWESWSSWKKMDPTAVYSYSDGGARGKGAWFTWDGPESGKGKLSIKESNPNSSIKTLLDFGAMGTGHGTWKFEADGADKTKVTWSFYTEANGFSSKMMLPLMDSMLGPSLQEGLTAMKEIAAKNYKEAAAKAAQRKALQNVQLRSDAERVRDAFGPEK